MTKYEIEHSHKASRGRLKKVQAILCIIGGIILACIAGELGEEVFAIGSVIAFVMAIGLFVIGCIQEWIYKKD
jgi:hypothetical protein